MCPPRPREGPFVVSTWCPKLGGTRETGRSQRRVLCKRGGGGVLTSPNISSHLLYLVTEFFGWRFSDSEGEGGGEYDDLGRPPANRKRKCLPRQGLAFMLSNYEEEGNDSCRSWPSRRSRHFREVRAEENARTRQARRVSQRSPQEAGQEEEGVGRKTLARTGAEVLV